MAFHYYPFVFTLSNLRLKNFLGYAFDFKVASIVRNSFCFSVLSNVTLSAPLNKVLAMLNFCDKGWCESKRRYLTKCVSRGVAKGAKGAIAPPPRNIFSYH